MNFSQDFFLKHRLVVMKLSRDLFVTELDQQLRTIDYYIEQFSVSRGTIQAAMQFLITEGCITTQFRGHLGTFLLTKDMGKLWAFTGFGTLTGAMPLPLQTRASGFATGICDCMGAANIAFNCIFIQGSQTRLNGLLQGKYDFIVVTKLAEQVLKEEYTNIEKIMDLPGCSYNSKYIFLFKDPEKEEIEDGMMVAVDPTSVDQAYLAKIACENKKNITFLKKPSYLSAHLSVKEGESDVAITNIAVASSLGPEFQDNIKELKLSNLSKRDMEILSTPVILILKDNYGLDNILRQALRASLISNSQKKVMSGQLPPNYY
jgi:ABC-type amino acid transport substrate-binding protein